MQSVIRWGKKLGKTSTSNSAGSRETRSLKVKPFESPAMEVIAMDKHDTEAVPTRVKNKKAKEIYGAQQLVFDDFSENAEKIATALLLVLAVIVSAEKSAIENISESFEFIVFLDKLMWTL